MPTVTAELGSRTTRSSLPPAGQVDCLDPSQIRVVDVEHERTGEVVRRDCYDPVGMDPGDLNGVRKVFELVDGEVYVRAIDWARSAEMDADVALRWIPTGMQVQEVDQIRVSTWPDAELSQVFRHSD